MKKIILKVMLILQFIKFVSNLVYAENPTQTLYKLDISLKSSTIIEINDENYVFSDKKYYILTPNGVEKRRIYCKELMFNLPCNYILSTKLVYIYIPEILGGYRIIIENNKICIYITGIENVYFTENGAKGGKVLLEVTPICY